MTNTWYEFTGYILTITVQNRVFTDCTNNVYIGFTWYKGLAIVLALGLGACNA